MPGGGFDVSVLLYPIVSVLVSALVIAGFNRLTGTTDEFATDFGSLALGFALWVATPVAVALLVVSGIGIPLGLALIAAYLVALLAGLLVALVALGALVTRGARNAARGRLVLALVVGLIVLGLLTWLPVAGVVAAAVGLVWGLGALVVHAHRLYARAA